MTELITIPESICNPTLKTEERAKISALAQLIRRNFKGVKNESMSNLLVNFNGYDQQSTLQYLQELRRSVKLGQQDVSPEKGDEFIRWVMNSLETSIDYAQAKTGRAMTRADIAAEVHKALQGI